MKKIQNLLLGISVTMTAVSGFAAPSGQSPQRLTATSADYAGKLIEERPEWQNPKRRSVTDGMRQSLNTIGNTWNPSLRVLTNDWNAPRVAGKEAETGRKARGIMVSSHGWTDGDQTGVYDFPIAGNYNFTLLGKQYDMYKVTAHCDDGTYVSSEWVRKNAPNGMANANIVRVFDDETYELIREVWGTVEYDYDADAMCYDPTSGNLYIFYYNFSGGDYCLGVLNPADGSKRQIATYGKDFQVISLFHDNKGMLYGGNREGTVFSFDPKTGEKKQLFTSQMESRYACSGAVNPDNGLLYYLTANGDSGGRMYSCNLTSGETKIEYYTPYGEEILGMFFPTEISPEAPAVVTDLTMNAAAGSLKGEVTFKTPKCNRAGAEKTGKLTYTLIVDGAKSVEGETSFGGISVTVPFEVKESGTHTLSVKVANEAGESKLVSIYPYIGADSPTDVKNLKFTWKEGVSTITYSAIEAVHGGYLDPDNTYYIITRWENGKPTVVAEKHTDTTFTENYAEPEDHLMHLYYTVQASANGITSAIATSQTETMGTVIPPYYDDFEAENCDIWILDNNQDGVTWGVWEDSKGQWIAYQRSRKVQADDYAVLPKMKLTEGNTYMFSMNAWCRNASYTEAVAVYAGETPTAEGLSTVVIEPTDLKTDDMTNKLTGSFVCRKTGTYYFGIKVLSQPKTDFLFVDNVRVSEAQSANLPSSVTEFKVEADANGANKAVISYVAPTMTLIGGKIDKLTKVEIKRDGEVVATRTPAPGATDTYEDTNVKSGWHTYSVTAYNEFGGSIPVEKKIFVGFDLPSVPTKVNAVRGADTGEAIISWEAVTEDIQGHQFPEGKVSYILAAYIDGNATVVARDIKTTTYTHKAVSADKQQQFVQYAVFATTSEGNSEPSGVAALAMGKPDTLPWRESFADMKLTQLWAQVTHYGACQWSLIGDRTYAEIASQDGDNGLVCHQGPGEYYSSTLLSGLIDLKGATHPTVQFYFHTMDELDENTIQITVFDGQKFERIGVPVVLNRDGVPYDWAKAVVSLDSYKGKTIQVGLTVTSVMYGNTYMDNVKVYDRPEYEIGMADIITPEEVSANDTVPVVVKVENLGFTTNDAYSVTLYADGKEIKTIERSSLISTDVDVLKFEVPTGMFTPETLNIEASLTSKQDNDTSNNKLTASVKMRYPYMAPVPTDLEVAETGEDGSVTIQWTAPDLSKAPTEPILDDFEKYEAFAVKEAGDWKFHDFDHHGCGGFKGIIIPNMPVNNLDASFFIFNCSDEQFQGPGYNFEALSGKQYLAVLYNYDGSETDNWAVSPELSGTAQTISLMARSHFESYPEKFDILYSTGSNDPKEFKLLASRSNLPAEWMEYSFDLPEGARYFAIRQKSEHTDMLMIDDVHYSPKGATHNYVIEGYNIYRDGEKLNAQPIATQSYKLTDKIYGDHSYNVTAVYTVKGESTPSNTLIVNMLGLSDIEASENGETIYYNTQGIRVLDPQKGETYIMLRNGKAVKGIFR